MGKTVGTPVELRVGQSLPVADEGHRIRRKLDLPLEPLVQTGSLGKGRRTVPPRDRLTLLSLGQQRQVLQPRVRISGHPFEQRLKMAQHASDDDVIEALPRVLDLQKKLAVAIGNDRQWIAGMAEIQKAALAPGATQSTQLFIERMAIEHQDALEERRTTRHVAPALDLGERRVLEFAQRHVLGPQLPQPRNEFGFRINAHAYRQRIDEQAEHAPGTVEARPATGTGCAEHDVRFAAIAVQQQSPGALQQHGERYRRLTRTPLQSRRECSRQTDLMRSPDASGDVLGLAITRHDQRSRRTKPRKNALPVSFGGVVIEFAKPLDMVSKRTRQRKVGVSAAQEGLIESKDFPPHQKP